MTLPTLARPSPQDGDVPDPAARTRPEGRRMRAAVFAFAAVAGLAPVLLVRRPPVLDLAPQADQARLFLEVLGSGGGSAHAIAWLAPNRISYLPLVLGRLLGGEAWGARLGLALVMLGALAAIHLLAARFRRPPETALLASVFLFSSAFYGGFFNFVLGVLAFALWAAELERAPDARAAAPRALGLGALLYLSHVLWLLAAAALAALDLAVRPAARRATLRRLAALAPFLLAATIWHLSMAGSAWSTGVAFRSPPILRALRPGFFETWLLGGTRGALEPVTLAVLALWCAAGLVRGRAAAPAEPGSAPLARAAALLLGAALVLPTAYGQTTQLATRWLPWAALCAVLACPPPPLAPRARVALAGALLAAFVGATATIWERAEREEMAHFEEALAAVPPSAALLGLDLEHRSRWFRRSPAPNLFHYAASERDARLAFGFDQVASSLVLRRSDPEHPGWDYQRTTYLFSLRGARLRPFSHLLLHARPAAQAAFGERYARWRRVGGDGSWVLWENPVPAAAPPPRRRRPQLGREPSPSAAEARSSTAATVRPVRRSKR